MTDIRVRFAPSPTGDMHIGHLRAAIPNALHAMRTGGTFIVRFEDTDLERNKDDAEKNILADLEWLGLVPNESPIHGGDFAPYRTCERAENGDYERAVEKLMADGRAYECFVSTDELDLMRKLQRQRHEAPHYDNRHRDLSAEEKAKFRAEGREPVIRFKLNSGEIVFNDLVRGEVKFHTDNLGGDPVIVRSNGVPLFALAGAVDDINQKMTHVIRGEDHLANTAIQVQIFEALGGEVPHFAHVPMMLDENGQKFSKRLGSLSVKNLREMGYLPEAIVAYMASLGFGYTVEARSLQQIADLYEFDKMGRAAVRFDIENLKRVNAMYMHALEFEDAKLHLEKFLTEYQITHPRMQEFWNTNRANLQLLTEVSDQFNMCFGDIQAPSLDQEDKDYICAALEILPAGPYNEETWSEWVGQIKAKTGRKGKGLFMPLRLALTGQEHGPELANLLPVMGEDRTRKRMQDACC